MPRRQLLKALQCVHGFDGSSKKGVRVLGGALERAGEKMAQLASLDMPTGKSPRHTISFHIKLGRQ